MDWAVVGWLREDGESEDNNMSVTHERVHQTFRSLYGRPGLENTNILDIASEVANNDCSVLVDVCADEETNKRRPDGSKINKHPKVCDRQSQWWTDKAIELNLRQELYGPFKTKYHEFASKCRDSTTDKDSQQIHRDNLKWLHDIFRSLVHSRTEKNATKKIGDVHVALRNQRKKHTDNIFRGLDLRTGKPVLHRTTSEVYVKINNGRWTAVPSVRFLVQLVKKSL